MAFRPNRSRTYTAAQTPFNSIAARMLGASQLDEIAEFFIIFQTMYDGFVERARAVTETLEDRRTTFVVVSTLESAPIHEAEFFVDALTARNFNLGAVVFNKVLPDYLLDPGAEEVARRLVADSDKLAAALPPGLGDPAHAARVLREVGGSFLNYRVVATREAEQRSGLAAVPDLVASAPFLDRDVSDLAGLLRLGEHIWR